MGLTTALLEYARSVIERDLYDSSNWRSAATREELRQNLSAPFFHEKRRTFYLPPPLLVKPPYFLFPSIRQLPWNHRSSRRRRGAPSPQVGSFQAATPQPIPLSLSMPHLPKSSHQPLSHSNETLTTTAGDEHLRQEHDLNSRRHPIPLSHVHFSAHPPPFLPRPNPKLICRFQWWQQGGKREMRLQVCQKIQLYFW
jgi:hypothetical protein